MFLICVWHQMQWNIVLKCDIRFNCDIGPFWCVCGYYIMLSLKCWHAKNCGYRQKICFEKSSAWRLLTYIQLIESVNCLSRKPVLKNLSSAGQCRSCKCQYLHFQFLHWRLPLLIVHDERQVLRLISFRLKGNWTFFISWQWSWVLISDNLGALND